MQEVVRKVKDFLLVKCYSSEWGLVTGNVVLTNYRLLITDYESRFTRMVCLQV